jgi:hypothetical protein
MLPHGSHLCHQIYAIDNPIFLVNEACDDLLNSQQMCLVNLINSFTSCDFAKQTGHIICGCAEINVFVNATHL